MKAIHALVVGASGYSGELLVQILSRHPGIADLQVASRQYAGAPIGAALPTLCGSRFADSLFVASDPSALAASDAEICLLALPHGVAAEFALPLLNAGKRVIDLSADFRLDDPGLYSDYYGGAHPAPEFLAKTPYVLPEWAANEWKDAPLIACPGCYPTSVLLPLLPLLRDRLVDASRIVINAQSGVSGAGKKADAFYSYCERADSVLAYGRLRHRHLAEIEQELAKVWGEPLAIQFTPHLIPTARGIHTTIVVPAEASQQAIESCWQQTYKGLPFVRVLDGEQTPDTRHVVGTNRIDFSGLTDPRTGNLLITIALDNLIKGAGGQAVQIMNRICGWEESLGLW